MFLVFVFYGTRSRHDLEICHNLEAVVSDNFLGYIPTRNTTFVVAWQQECNIIFLEFLRRARYFCTVIFRLNYFVREDVVNTVEYVRY